MPRRGYAEIAFRQFGPHRFRKLHQPAIGNPAHPQNEFLAAQPARAAAETLLERCQPAPERHEHLVARLMPELVVDGLELVHVDEQQADGPPGRAAECLGVFAEEAPAVQQAGKRIAFGKFGQGLADLHRPVALHPQGAQPHGRETGQAHDLQRRSIQHQYLVAPAPQDRVEIDDLGHRQRHHGDRPADRQIAGGAVALPPPRGNTGGGQSKR